MERATKEGKSPVNKNIFMLLDTLLEYHEKRKPREKQGILLPKAKYLIPPIVNKYREGKMKSSPVRAVK